MPMVSGTRACAIAWMTAGIDYSYTLKADPRFLIGPVLPGEERSSGGSRPLLHVRRLIERDGKQYAAILDNNYPGDSELTPRAQFIAYGLATEALPYRSQ